LLRNTLEVAFDPKVSSGVRTFLYLPPEEDAHEINLKVGERNKINNNTVSVEIKIIPNDMIVTNDHGILYLPHNYVVPGGRFNEMYAWDSYWIILGLLKDHHTEIARGIVENFIYQIKYYGGKCLNANRTYYLTRSQLPMLALMVMAVLPTFNKEERTDFLQRATDALAQEYEGFWKRSRYDEKNELFHYGNKDQGALGLCPEVAFGERDDKGLSHYDRIITHLRGSAVDDPTRLRFYDTETNSLSLEGIAGDRAMRESGFDASMHMGYYGLQTIDYDPVCLNSLLYMQCHLIEKMYKKLDQEKQAKYYHNEAKKLKSSIQKKLWNEEKGLFYNFNSYESHLSDFTFLTCVYPLWARVATVEQAQRFRDNLHIFETPFGLKTTDIQTGCQWDAPFMWAPLIYLTVKGLENYGYLEDAQRIARKFIDTVDRVHSTTNANFEKYNAETGDCQTEGIIDVGYTENVVGFGWTNGAVRMLQSWLETQDDL
jgi:alpha,alpha-trehalase